MEWILYIVLGLICLIYGTKYLHTIITKSKINKIINNCVMFCGTMGKGKTALMTGIARNLQKKRKCNLYSNYAIEQKNKEFSYQIPFTTFHLNEYKSPFPFIDNDIIAFSEASIFFPAEHDRKKLSDFRATGTGMFLKFIRHMINGTAMFDEQHPNRVNKHIREKVQWYIQVIKMNKPIPIIMPFISFDIMVFSEIEDYGKVISTKSENKKLKKQGFQPTIPQFQGEAKRVRLTFTKKDIYGKYETRAFSFIGEIKRTQSEYIPTRFKTLNLDANELKNIVSDELKIFFDNITGKPTKPKPIKPTATKKSKKTKIYYLPQKISKQPLKIKLKNLKSKIKNKIIIAKSKFLIKRK